MFKLLRSKAKIFYWVIAASFVLFIFLAWGMQYSGRSSTAPSGPRYIGAVNGEAITVQEWSDTYQDYLARLRQQLQDRNLTANQRAQASEFVWSQLVQQKLESQAIRRFKLSVSDEEIVDVLRNSPPPELLQAYADENGNPDFQAYLSDLSNPDRDWSRVEDYIRQIIPRQKLYRTIAADVAVTDEEVMDEYIKQTGRAVAEYVGVLFRDLDMDVEDLEETEIAAWYNGHLDDYLEPERHELRVATLPKAASELDREEVIALAGDIKREIEAGEMDFAEAAAIYSEDEGTRENGGDLGTFDRRSMVAPFTEAAFSLPVGELSDPVETEYGVHVIEVLEQETEDGEVVRVHARHILLPMAPGDLTLADLYDRIGEFRENAAEIGFEAAAAADSALTVLNPDPVRAGWDLPGVPDSMAGGIFVSTAEPGDISPVYQNDDLYYVVECLGHLPEAPAPLEQVRDRVAGDLLRQKKLEAGREKLRPALASLAEDSDMAAVAAANGLVHAVTDTFTATGNVADVGWNTDFNAVAMKTPAGQLSEIVETDRGVFALRVLWRQPFDAEAFAQQQSALRNRIAGQRQQEIVQAWFEDQLADSDIEDNRQAFFGGS